jgi:hypothetical protein
MKASIVLEVVKAIIAIVSLTFGQRLINQFMFLVQDILCFGQDELS